MAGKKQFQHGDRTLVPGLGYEGQIVSRTDSTRGPPTCVVAWVNKKGEAVERLFLVSALAEAAKAGR